MAEKKLSNTNLGIDRDILKRFKKVIKDQGYRLKLGIEKALSEYIKKHGKKEGVEK